MSKPSFSLTEQAIENIACNVKDAPIDRIKLLRLLHHVSLKLDERFSQSLKPLGVNQTEWMTLIFLFSAGSKKFFPSELAKSLNCSRTNATRLIEALKKRSFIHCTVNSSDRRKMQISLNQEGRAFVDKHLPEQFQNVNEMVEDIFTREEEELFFNLNMKMLKYLEQKKY